MYPVPPPNPQLVDRPLPACHSIPLDHDFCFSPTPEPFSPTSSPPCPGSPCLPRNLAPAPPPAPCSFPWVPAARPLSPVVGGEGSGGWHPFPRCAPRFSGGGAGARVSRCYELCPALNPASRAVLNPALPAGHPGGHPRTLNLRNVARWSARTRTRFSATTPSLVHVDQLAAPTHREPSRRRAAAGVLAASSQSPIASRTILRISTAVSPSVKHPGSSGTLTE